MNGQSETIRHKKAFVWDFDGCLCDTEALQYEAYMNALKPFGISMPISDYLATFVHLGEGLQFLNRTRNLGWTSREFEQIALQKNIEYGRLISKTSDLIFPELLQVLPLLKKFGKVGIASNSPFEEISELLSKSKNNFSFDSIVGKTTNLRKKPAPDIFLKALETLNINPSDVLIFEDSERGLAAAHAAGVDAIWIQTENNKSLESTQPFLYRMTHSELLKHTIEAFHRVDG